MTEYTLVGFVNMFNVTPDFVFPVFQADNKLYFQIGKQDQLECFVPVKNTVYPMIHYIDNSEIRLTKNDKPIYAFQTEENNFIYGTATKLLNFFEKYHTTDDILIEEIQDFKKDVYEDTNYICVSTLVCSARFYGTGRRKTSVARVYMRPGSGKIIINKKPINEYFNLPSTILTACQPLIITNTIDEFDVVATVQGGGFSGQAGAIQHGIARALLTVNVDKYKNNLKKAGLLTRDSRMKERKKYGLKAARRAPQFSKR